MRTVTRRATPAPRAVVMTMVRDEAFMLPRWIDHYSRQLGLQSLIVLDDNSVDGSTDNLPCTMYRLPAPPWKRDWGPTRTQLVNGMARGLLACNDVVIYTDVDEFLVADPAKFAGLREYLVARADRPVVAPLALELMHNTRVEPALDRSRPILEQRRFVKFSPGMCKPLVKRVPEPWQHAFHRIRAPFEIDPHLWMLHLKYADERVLEHIAENRRVLHEVEGRGHPRSFWPMGADRLKRLLFSWTEGGGEPGAVPDFDAGEADVGHLVARRDDGWWASVADPVDDIGSSPLRELPARFRGIF